MPWGPTTKDGRCWACNQRRRFYPAAAWQIRGSGGVRHAMSGRTRLCSLPRARASAEVRRDWQRAYYARWKAKGGRASPAANRRRRLKHFYGITVEEADAMIARFDGKCWCCKESPATDIDHDHETGAVRGVLCGKCNRMLGQANDDPERLRAGVRYLSKAFGSGGRATGAHSGNPPTRAIR